MMEEIFGSSHGQLYQLEVAETAGEVEALIALNILESTVETGFHSITANMREILVLLINIDSVGGRVVSKRVVEMAASDV